MCKRCKCHALETNYYQSKPSNVLQSQSIYHYLCGFIGLQLLDCGLALSFARLCQMQPSYIRTCSSWPSSSCWPSSWPSSVLAPFHSSSTLTDVHCNLHTCAQQLQPSIPIHQTSTYMLGLPLQYLHGMFPTCFHCLWGGLSASLLGTLSYTILTCTELWVACHSQLL